MYCPIVILVKVSILLQYITIFVVNRGNAFHYIIRIILWTNVVFYTIVFFLVVFQVSSEPDWTRTEIDTKRFSVLSICQRMGQIPSWALQ